MNSLPELKIGNLTAKYPIIQGGMGVGISLSSLAGAVTKAGGIGVISAAHPGFLEPDFETNTLGANLRALKKHIARAKELSGGGIIGVNIMCAMNHYEDFVRASVEGGADLIISGAGLPADLPAMIGGSNIKLAPIVSPPKAAKVILKRWASRYHRVPDLIVIEGPEAGGHLGFRAEDADRCPHAAYDTEILEILTLVKEYEQAFQTSVPVVFAGGVFDHKDILHYLSLGLSGVQIASRFVATEECDADRRYKEAYIAAREEDIAIVKSPVGMPGRALRNEFVKRAEAQRIPVPKCFGCIRTCNPSDTPYCISRALINAAKGELSEALIFCGANVGRIDRITSVPALMRELTEG